jgi:hypothetical protein
MSYNLNSSSEYLLKFTIWQAFAAHPTPGTLTGATSSIGPRTKPARSNHEGHLFLVVPVVA